MRFFCTVYGNPLPKERPRVVNGHAYTPARTKAWEREIATAYRAQGGPLFTGPVAVYVWCYRGDRRRVDCDNLLKCCMDALNDVAWRDDTQIVELHAWKGSDPGNPRLEIEIQTIAEPLP